MDRGVWRATVHGVTKELDMTEYTHTHTYTQKGRDEKERCVRLGSLRTGCQNMNKYTMILLKEILVIEKGKGTRKDW